MKLPVIADDKQHAFVDLVKYLVLEDYMQLLSSVVSFASVPMIQSSAGVEISANEQRFTAIPTGAPCYRTVIWGPPIRHIAYMKCRICKIAKWLFLGIGANLDLSSLCKTHAQALSYGWAHPKQEWIEGKDQAVSLADWCDDDWVLLRADMLSCQLSIVSARGSSALVLPIVAAKDAHHSFYFQIVLLNDQDCVELLPVTRDDQRELP